MGQTFSPSNAPEPPNRIARDGDDFDGGAVIDPSQPVADLSAVEQSLPLTEGALTRARMKIRTLREITVKLPPRKLVVPAVALVALVAIIIGLMRFLPKAQSTALDSIAVLPFRSLSADKKQEYWADAITVAMTAKLGQVSGLKKVISSQLAMTFKGSNKRAPEIGRELEMNGLVQGSVLRSENRVRISVQLIDARTDRQLWSREFDCEIKDIIALQNEAARAIVKEIGVKLTAAEEKRLSGLIDRGSPEVVFLNGMTASESYG